MLKSCFSIIDNGSTVTLVSSSDVDAIDTAKKSGFHVERIFTESDLKISTASNGDLGVKIWRSKTEVFKRFVSDSQYQKFSEGVRVWYEPFLVECDCNNSMLAEMAAEIERLNKLLDEKGN